MLALTRWLRTASHVRDRLQSVLESKRAPSTVDTATLDEDLRTFATQRRLQLARVAQARENSAGNQPGDGRGSRQRRRRRRRHHQEQLVDCVLFLSGGLASKANRTGTSAFFSAPAAVLLESQRKISRTVEEAEDGDYVLANALVYVRFLLALRARARACVCVCVRACVCNSRRAYLCRVGRCLPLQVQSHRPTTHRIAARPRPRKQHLARAGKL